MVAHIIPMRFVTMRERARVCGHGYLSGLERQAGYRDAYLGVRALCGEGAEL